MRPEVFRFVSLVGSFILASSTLGLAQVTDGERTNFAADFFEHLDVVKGGISFGFGEHAISRSIETQTMLIRHTATKLQRQVAEQNARTYIAKLSPEKKQQLKKKKVKYLAVPTVRSKETSPTSEGSLDDLGCTKRDSGQQECLRATVLPPRPGSWQRYDDMVAEYVGH